jgi:hypothetical protein
VTPGEFKEIAKAMQEHGIVRVQMRDCLIERFSAVAPHVNPPEIPKPVLTPDDPIKHRVDQMTSLMKLSDNELVDELFPDKTDEIA